MKNTTQHLIRLSEQDRDRVELIGAAYGFPVAVVHRLALRFLFSLTGLPDGPDQSNADVERRDMAGST